MSYVYLVSWSAGVLLTFAGCTKYQELEEKLPFIFPNYVRCNVVKVIDGDKFDCQLPNIQIERIKMIGVQIPASFEERADSFTRSELHRGLPVRLEPDQLTTDGVNLLAYVYLAGGQMVNSLLIEEGYAEYSGEPPNLRYDKYLSKLESEAKKKGKGIWRENKEINK
ncbi:MAG: thermonuclease family protein [Thermodesulfobacteriota bacterium]